MFLFVTVLFGFASAVVLVVVVVGGGGGGCGGGGGSGTGSRCCWCYGCIGKGRGDFGGVVVVVVVVVLLQMPQRCSLFCLLSLFPSFCHLYRFVRLYFSFLLFRLTFLIVCYRLDHPILFWCSISLSSILILHLYPQAPCITAPLLKIKEATRKLGSRSSTKTRRPTLPPQSSPRGRSILKPETSSSSTSSR